jgi:hypothetical protein
LHDAALCAQLIRHGGCSSVILRHWNARIPPACSVETAEMLEAGQACVELCDQLQASSSSSASSVSHGVSIT